MANVHVTGAGRSVNWPGLSALTKSELVLLL